MLMIALCSSLVGAVLGTRLRVQVLFPVSAIAFVVVAGVGVLREGAMFPAIVAATTSVIALQIGYLGGLFTRFCVAAARVASKRSLQSTAARS